MIILMLTVFCVINEALTIETHTHADGVFTTSGIEKKNATEEFLNAGFVPRITERAPSTTLEVSYYYTEVVFGNYLSSLIVRLAPTTISWSAERDKFYTLIMVGPDCPAQDDPSESEFQHWIVVNIPGNNIMYGENITEYAGIVKNYRLDNLTIEGSSSKKTICFVVLIEPLLLYVNCEDVSGPSAAAIRRLNDTLMQENILPDIVPEKTLSLVKIRYRRWQIEAGQEVDSMLVRKTPDYLFWPYDENSLYTLIVTGPDAPSEKDREHSEYQHWLKGNIPGCEHHNGTLLTAYVADVPSYAFGKHKLIYLVFKQPGNRPIQFDEKIINRRPIGLKRILFSTKDFVKKYNLGHPVAGTYFVMNIGVKVPDVL